MGLWEHWPYTNFHELNLDWICRFVKKVRDRLDLIDKAVADAQEARDKSEEYSLESEAWAVGTKNGEPVDADAPQHENNSKYWAQHASERASDAKYSADAAADSALDAKGYAEDAAASAADTTQADAAKAWAQQSEAWAVGTKNGVAVGSDEPQYENNSKYYAQQAATDAQAAAQAVINDVTKYAITNVALARVFGVEVRAARTFVNSGGTQLTLNIPGLICFTTPFEDTGSTTPIETIDGVKFGSPAMSHIISAWAAGNNMLRDNRYLVQEMVDGYGAPIRIDNKDYQIHMFTVFDYVTGNFATDGTTFDLEFVIARSYYDGNGNTINGATVDLGY